MPPGQDAVANPSIKTIHPALFPWLKREVSPCDGARRQQACKKDIGAKVHVVVAVHAARVFTVDPAELLQLRLDQVIEGIGESWMIHSLGKAVAQ